MPRSRFELRPPAPYSLTLTAGRLGRLPNDTDHYDGTYRRLLIVENQPLLLAVTQSAPPSRPALDVRLEGEGARRVGARAAAAQHEAELVLAVAEGQRVCAAVARRAAALEPAGAAA